MNLCALTFSKDLIELPTIKKIKEFIVLDTTIASNSTIKNTYKIRNQYTKNSFCLLSHEFLSSVIKMIQQFSIKTSVELAAGCGWLTFWIKKYGFDNIIAIDNMSWAKKQNWDTLDLVIEKDAIEFVKNDSKSELYILSWPYMDDMAEKIWDAMNVGQYLFYIGETSNGCTANETFFNETKTHKIECAYLYKSFRSFWGLYDSPQLFKK